MKYKKYIKFIGGASNNNNNVPQRHNNYTPSNTIISSIWLFILFIILVASQYGIKCSEFPERECCDPPPIYPSIPQNNNNNYNLHNSNDDDDFNNNINPDLIDEQLLPTITTSLQGSGGTGSSTTVPQIGRSGKNFFFKVSIEECWKITLIMKKKIVKHANFQISTIRKS